MHQWGLQLDPPLLLAGPCSAENREQVLATAEGIVRHAPNVRVFRAGVWKPRTRPGGFEGRGAEALPWLQEVKERTGLLTAIEVATPQHVELALAAGIDMLWVGARTTPNPFSVQALADALQGSDVPVLVKNPINPDLQLWIGALERFTKAGITRLAAVHRGFSWFERTPYRNSPMWEFPVRLRASFPELPVLCDPSHIAGVTDRVAEVAQQALDLGFSGLMVESHVDPSMALSDAAQQLRPEQLGALLHDLVFRTAAADLEQNDPIADLRELIDQLDEEILQKLAARMAIAERIGDHKLERNLAILQPERWRTILDRQTRLGQQLGLDPAFVSAFMDAIHNESIRHQRKAWEAVGPPQEDHSMG